VQPRKPTSQLSRARLKRVGLVATLALAAATFPAAASATVFQVTNTNDPGTGSCIPGSCSLRDAITAADSGTGSDTVLVPAGLYTLGAGFLPIVNGMHIVGTAGAAVTIIDAHNASEVIKINGAAEAVSINGLTLTRGQSPKGSAINSAGAQLTLSEDMISHNTSGAGAGQGAVSLEGLNVRALTVTSSTFTGNAAGGEGTKTVSSGQGLGGAIDFSAKGTLSVTGSTFTENTAGGRGGEGTSSAQGLGGAIFASGDDAVAISNSTFTGNKAGGNGGAGTSSAQGNGGAIGFIGAAAADTLTVLGSTFTGNQAGGSAGSGPSSGEGAGGALSTLGEGSVTLTNDTLNGNSVGGPIGAASGAGAVGGGLDTTLAATLLNDTLDGNAVIGALGAGGNIDASPGSVSLKNTISAGGAAASGANCAGTVTSAGHNIESTAPSQCGLSPALADLIGVNPLLGALQPNGGPTPTQALLSGSPALNAGDNNGCPAGDQRGVARPQGPACDIGAYELAPPTATTGAASAIGTSTATLAGAAVNPDVLGATAFFQWGTSTAYGSQTPPQLLGAAIPATQFSAALSKLASGVLYHFRAVVVNPDGTRMGADQTFITGTGAHIASLSALSETNSVFVVAPSSTPKTGQTAAKRHHKGTVFSFRLDQPATVKIAIQAPARGRRVHRSCKPDTHKLRHKPRCTRTVTIVTFTRSGHAGANRVAFTGRIGGKALKPGRYKAVFIAVDAAGASAPHSLSFTIVKR
jgi:hypothetical protein